MITLVTLNLNYYAPTHGPWESRKAMILQALREKDADVVLFQAVARHADRDDGKDQAFQLSEALDGFSWHFFQQAQMLSDGTEQGSAVISRLPIAQNVSHMLTLDPGFDDSNRRVVIRSSFNTAEGTLDVYNAHFSWVDELAAKNIEETLAFIEHGSERFLLAGDLNTPASERKRFTSFEEAGLIDAWKYLHADKAGFTFESDKPSVRIDYVWLSPALADRLESIGIIAAPHKSKYRFSDHLALMAKLQQV